jgi:2-dehydropantoate 2-reductase
VLTEYTPDIRRKKWVKLCANVAFSATSGVTGLTIAEVALMPELRRSAMRAIDETAAVAAACGIEIDAVERREIFDALTDPAGAGTNTTSMYRDLAAGRATEVDSIYGTVIRLGEGHRIPTPTLETLAAIVKGLEAANAAVVDTGRPRAT